ncbi:hypothetical protein M0R19_04680 [Candidatus Pacearchaeota archaeon]|jgi:flagellar biogenesis protein FliO|nr:hypothetical protein [Candidatus Pacearchaeota archaeon]
MILDKVKLLIVKSVWLSSLVFFIGLVIIIGIIMFLCYLYNRLFENVKLDLHEGLSR